MKRSGRDGRLILGVALAIVGAGCGGGSQPPLSVSPISATALQLAAAATSQLSVTVSSDSTNAGVNWSISCSAASCGSVSPTHSASGAKVTYTAPPLPPASNFAVTITAASQADPTKVSSSQITVLAVVVSLSAAPATVVTTTTVQLSATVQNDPASAGVAWSVSCSAAKCGSVAPVKTASAQPTTYTPPSSVVGDLNVTITASSVTDATKSIPDPITVVPPLAVSTTSLPNGTGGIVYNQTLQATGGLPPYNWSLAGGSVLPAGLSLNSDGSVTGTPTAGGTFNFSVQVSDSGSPQLNAPGALAITIVILPLSVSTTSLPNGAVDTAYSQALQATGGVPPYNWEILSGNPPVWTSFDSQGVIAGFPNASGTSNFTVQVSDAEATAQTAKQPLGITVVKSAGANDAELKGQYAFSLSGFDDVTGSPIVTVGSFTADGAGNLINGVEDSNGPAGAAQNVPFTGTYSIGADNRGAFTLQTDSGTRTYACVIGSLSGGIAANGRLIEFDDTNGTSGQRGSGVLRLQDTAAFTLGSITGPYAFGLVGQDSSANRSAVVGSITMDGAGNIKSGLADMNVAGKATNPSLTGNYTLPAATAANGKILLTLNLSTTATWSVSAYIVSANELLAVTMDELSSEGLHSGTILLQKSASFTNSSLNAPAVLYDSWNRAAEVAVLTPDGNSSMLVNLDRNDGGSLTKNNSFTGSFTVTSVGRVTVSNWGASTNPPRYLYLVDANKGFYLDSSSLVGFGFIEPQAAAPAGGFTTAYLSGAFLSGTLPPTSANMPTASAQGTVDGASKFNETVDLSLTTGLIIGQTTNGTYSVTDNGRGTVTTLSTSSSGLFFLLPPLILALLAVLACAGRRCSPVPALRPALATLLLLAAVTLVGVAGCTFPAPQLVFYIISPTKFVLIDQSDLDKTPTIAVFEQ